MPRLRTLNDLLFRGVIGSKNCSRIDVTDTGREFPQGNRIKELFASRRSDYLKELSAIGPERDVIV